jgi:hypothetical protein
VEKIKWNIVKPCLWTGAAGIIVGMFALAKVFGFMSPSAADQLASQKVETAVIATMAPVCAEKFRALPDATQRMATLVAKKGGYDQKDVFPEALVTLPGKSYAEYALVDACAKLLLAPPKSAALK